MKVNLASPTIVETILNEMDKAMLNDGMKMMAIVTTQEKANSKAISLDVAACVVGNQVEATNISGLLNDLENAHMHLLLGPNVPKSSTISNMYPQIKPTRFTMCGILDVPKTT
jgi:hypothetical protein